MGELSAGLRTAVLGLAATFLFFGILLGCVGFMGRLAARQKGRARARPPLREPEEEVVALLAALYACLPRMAEGEYVLRLGAEERTLRIGPWRSGRGTIEVAGRSLDVEIREDNRQFPASSSLTPKPETESHSDSER